MRHLVLAELPALGGTILGTSDWVEIGQDRIDDFARVTGDHQWIHVDTERARATSRDTIAHGMLVLSLIPALAAELYHVDDAVARINYGLDRVRFPTTVPAGSLLRDRVTLLDAQPRGDSGAMLARFEHRIESQGATPPACVAITSTLFTRETA